MSNELIKAKKKDLQTLLNTPAIMDRLKEILGRNAATFATSVVQITQSNALLVQAEPNSIVGAAMTAATLNLPLNNSLGFAYIVPYNVNVGDGTKVVKAQFQIGYKGFIQLAMRSGQFKTIHSTDVRQGEISSRDRLTGEMDFNFIDDDAERLQAPIIGYVAFFKLLNGFEATLYMSMAEIMSHGKRFSKSFSHKNGLWQTDQDSMATKTVLKLLLSKKAPLSIEMQKAIEVDQAAFNDIEDTEDISYVDNEEVKIDHEAERERSFQLALVEDLTTEDDFIHAVENVTLPDLREKMFRRLIDNAATEQDFKFAEDLIDDEVLKTELQVKKVSTLKEKKSKK